jgi:DNA-binding response OmpR family regulator
MLNIGECASSVELSFDHCVTTEKVAWFSQKNESHWGVEFLVRYLREERFVIYPITRSQIRSSNLQNYQIFLIETKDKSDAALLEVILELRVQTLALIVILMEDPTSTEVVQLLGHGADAVWAINEPVHVLRARTRSLLRRSRGFNMEI